MLRQCSPPSLRRILKELPQSLDETYDCILKNINQATRAYAHRLLQCLTVAVWPLRLEELAEVLAFDFDDAPGGVPKLNADWRREDQERAVLSTCSSLITVVDHGYSRVVHFSHFSVKEFLTSDRLAMAAENISFHHIVLEPAHAILAQAYLGVLLRLDDSSREASIERFPLARYALEHWVEHAQFENVSLCVKSGIEDLFNVEKPHFWRWIRVRGNIYDGYSWLDATQPEQPEAAPMYWAAFYGLHDVMEKLIREYPEHVNALGGPCGTALHTASRRDHLNVVRLLLSHGASVNAPGERGWTPLVIASDWGRLNVVRCLLEHDANVNAKDKPDNETALHLAIEQGHVEIVWTLLKHNADTNARNDNGFTPLHLASSYERIDIVRLLLNHGADPKARDGIQETPLHMASAWGNLEVTHLLLEHGAEVNAEDEFGRTAYQIASDEGHHEVAQFLSAYGAESRT